MDEAAGAGVRISSGCSMVQRRGGPLKLWVTGVICWAPQFVVMLGWYAFLSTAGMDAPWAIPTYLVLLGLLGLGVIYLLVDLFRSSMDIGFKVMWAVLLIVFWCYSPPIYWTLCLLGSVRALWVTVPLAVLQAAAAVGYFLSIFLLP